MVNNRVGHFFTKIGVKNRWNTMSPIGATSKQIAEAAKDILRGRQLNEYQRKEYHIEK